MMKMMIAGTMVVLAIFVRASVCELQLVVSTTTTGEATVKESTNFCGVEGKIAYRRPSKMKIKAVVWGDECEMTQGAVVWNETLKVQYAPDSEFTWEFLNRIGKDGKDAEGLWNAELMYDTGDHAAHLYGGGSGKVKGDGQVSLSGNFAGYMHAGQIVESKTVRTCSYCGEVSVSVREALAWGICDCSESDDRTVAHGTWTMKYNATASKKYAKTGDIAAVYKFPKYVKP